MILKIIPDKKAVCIFLQKGETADIDQIRNSDKSLVDYTFCVYHPGNDDPIDSITGLITHNL